MFQLPNSRTPSTPEFHAIASRMLRLGETFLVRDVMIKINNFEYVLPGDLVAAREKVSTQRYSVVPASADGVTFETVFTTGHPGGGLRSVQNERAVSIADHIPESTPLAEAFFLFDSREWYLTLRANQVSGLITYWEFNSHEFRVQLYTVLSLVEALSRKLLADDGCGIADEKGINLEASDLAEPLERFQKSMKSGGGNRFVDELDFHQVHEALNKHQPWCNFILAKMSKKSLDKKYKFTTIRNDVMHGRVLFPTYDRFRKRREAISRMVEWIDHLYAYLSINRKAGAVR